MSYKQIKRVTFVWIAATSVNTFLLVIIGLFQTLVFKIVVLLAAVWLVLAFSKLLKNTDEKFDPFWYFMLLNAVLLVIILSMVIDPLV